MQIINLDSLTEKMTVEKHKKTECLYGISFLKTWMAKPLKNFLLNLNRNFH